MLKVLKMMRRRNYGVLAERIQKIKTKYQIEVVKIIKTPSHIFSYVPPKNNSEGEHGN